ncbi:hypothetical protein TcasGA2_TC004904 [Tribolium castaneum]|uniref:Uncharacterized protein n=1 Tax=Tribolium castaneum TaxID=7070 RepID=D6WCI9_TRICA|nr:hypothetical protein TcasGA2_TC004904 [Tribolium castaneum]
MQRVGEYQLSIKRMSTIYLTAIKCSATQTVEHLSTIATPVSGLVRLSADGGRCCENSAIYEPDMASPFDYAEFMTCMILFISGVTLMQKDDQDKGTRVYRIDVIPTLAFSEHKLFATINSYWITRNTGTRGIIKVVSLEDDLGNRQIVEIRDIHPTRGFTVSLIYCVLWVYWGVKTCIIGCTGSETDCLDYGEICHRPFVSFKRVILHRGPKIVTCALISTRIMGFPRPSKA